jgi:hypothetical protein
MAQKTNSRRRETGIVCEGILAPLRLPSVCCHGVAWRPRMLTTYSSIVFWRAGVVGGHAQTLGRVQRAHLAVQKMLAGNHHPAPLLVAVHAGCWEGKCATAIPNRQVVSNAKSPSWGWAASQHCLARPGSLLHPEKRPQAHCRTALPHPLLTPANTHSHAPDSAHHIDAIAFIHFRVCTPRRGLGTHHGHAHSLQVLQHVCWLKAGKALPEVQLAFWVTTHRRPHAPTIMHTRPIRYYIMWDSAHARAKALHTALGGTPTPALLQAPTSTASTQFVCTSVANTTAPHTIQTSLRARETLIDACKAGRGRGSATTILRTLPHLRRGA